MEPDFKFALDINIKANTARELLSELFKIYHHYNHQATQEPTLVSNTPEHSSNVTFTSP